MRAVAALLAVAIMIGFCFAFGTARAAQVAGEDNVVALPPLLVEESTAPLRWRYFAKDDLEVLSVCDDAVSEEFVRRHHRLEELLRVVLPDRFCVQLAVPEVHILFNEATGRARSREVIEEIVRKEGARVAADGTVMLPAAGPVGPFGRRTRVRFLPNIRLVDTDAVRVFAILQDGAEPMAFTFTKERIAFLLGRRAPALPDWFVDGMLEVFGRTKFREREIELTPIEWLSEEETHALARDVERPRTLLPLPELLESHRPAADDTSELARIWRAQAALFVRWALADSTGARREALWSLVDRLDGEPPSEALFQSCFGIGYSDARDRLSDYLPVAAGHSATLRAPKAAPMPRVRFRAASDLEVTLIRGDWERLQIGFVRRKYPALTDGYIAQARRTLRKAYDRGERDPRLLALLGLTECDAGNPAGARPFLEAAVQAQVARPRAHVELAQLRLEAMQAEANGRKLSAVETRFALAPALSARHDAPPQPQTYVLLARAWLDCAEPPEPDDLALLKEGVRLFPGVAALVLRAIHLHALHGDLASAAEMTALGLRHTRDATVRERLARVQAEISAVLRSRP